MRGLSEVTSWLDRLALHAGQLGVAAAEWPAWRRLLDAAGDPERAQRRRLRALLRASAASEYGRRHSFAAIDSVAAYQARVPLVDYARLEGEIQRVAKGEPRVLTGEAPLAVEVTSGSTATNKLIPYTRSLLAEFTAATHAWLFDLRRHYPALRGTRAYFSISPAARPPSWTEGGLPVGLPDDTAYLGPLLGRVVRHQLAVPPEVARLTDLARWRRETCLHLLRARDLGLISVWSPTFLSRLLSYLERELDRLLGELPAARAAEIRARVEAAGRLTAEALWPRLALVSCWTDGAARRFLPELQRYLPHTPVQGKGLLATEGVVSVPLSAAGEGALVAVTSHFLEFIDLEHPGRTPLLAHELRRGGAYSPVLSTGGGLYRYQLRDVVRCVGRFRRTPTLRFEGKLDGVSDLCGEKLHAATVERALESARERTGVHLRFALLAPLPEHPPRYCLFAESSDDDRALARVAEVVEESLRETQAYAYCRALGQLAPLEVARTLDGWDAFQRAQLAAGRRLGDIKPVALDGATGWRELLRAVPLPATARTGGAA